MRIIICESNFLNITSVVDDRLIVSALYIGGGLVVSCWVGNVLRNYLNRQSLEHKIKKKRQLLTEQLATIRKSLCDLPSEELEELDAIAAQPFDSLIGEQLHTGKSVTENRNRNFSSTSKWRGYGSKSVTRLSKESDCGSSEH
jgi:hypothetical protein